MKKKIKKKASAEAEPEKSEEPPAPPSKHKEAKLAAKAAAAKFSAAEKAKLAVEAIEEIRGFLKEVGYQGFKEHPYIPADWANKFKPALGSYKQFLRQHPDKFTVVDEDEGAGFNLSLAGSWGKPKMPANRPWEKGLVRAWSSYCQAVPRPRRDFQEFIGALPQSAILAAAVDAAARDYQPPSPPDSDDEQAFGQDGEVPLDELDGFEDGEDGSEEDARPKKKKRWRDS